MIGSIGVITHPLDDNVRASTAVGAFQSCLSDPRRAMIRACWICERFRKARRLPRRRQCAGFVGADCSSGVMLRALHL